MTFHPGQTVVRRYFRGDNVSWAQATRVLSDDGNGLRLWLPAGADFAYRVDAAGRTLRGESVADYAKGTLVKRRWLDSDVLMYLRPGAAHSVWWFFRDGGFTGWYVNLESPARRWRTGIDIVDHHLDIVVSPDRCWQWKDEEDFAASTDQPGFWTADKAQEIRAEGERILKEIEAGVFPFDGTWCGFAPDPDWPRPILPDDLAAHGEKHIPVAE